MEIYDRLYAKYGDWMDTRQVAETIGKTGHADSHSWPLDGLRGTKRKGTSKSDPTRWFYSTYDIALRLHKREQEAAQQKASLPNRCKSCRWHGVTTGVGKQSFISCEYCLRAGHHTKHYLALHDVPNALDTADCPLFEKDRVHHRTNPMNCYPPWGGRRSFDT